MMVKYQADAYICRDGLPAVSATTHKHAPP
jgi:hypothetical protein